MLRVVNTNSLLSPICGLSGNTLQQHLSPRRAPVIRMHRHAGHFADLLFRERIEGGAGDGGVIALNNGEFVDLHLQLFAGTAYQNALLLERAYQLKNTADIIDGRPTDLLRALHDDLGADAVA